MTAPAAVDLGDAVIATVAYSDVFDMPLARTELRRYLLWHRVEEAELDDVVDALVGQGELERRGDLLHLAGRAAVLDVHERRGALAARLWPRAERWVRVIAHLPFVRMVAVTGGLACDSVEADDDIDLLVVTVPGRVWLTRLAIVVVVKLAGLRATELCPNYLLAEDALELDDRSLYVARELAQTVPIVGVDVYRDLLDANAWHHEMLPNATGARTRPASRPSARRWFQRVTEPLLAHRLLDGWERAEMDRKVRRLRRVASRRPEVALPDETAFSPAVCKGHMDANASAISVAWRDRIGIAT